VSRRRRARLARWATELIASHGADVAAIVGTPPPLPTVLVEVSPLPGVAATAGDTITLHEPWFAAHPDDAGCVLHELSHAYLRAPVYDATTAWLIEGLADHVRDTLGFDASWTFAHHRAGEATAGYQTTAHFLAWLERDRPGTVRALARSLSAGSYAEDTTWSAVTGSPLAGLVAAYEAEHA
jgi:hypothetical protein